MFACYNGRRPERQLGVDYDISSTVSWLVSLCDRWERALAGLLTGLEEVIIAVKH